MKQRAESCFLLSKHFHAKTQRGKDAKNKSEWTLRLCPRWVSLAMYDYHNSLCYDPHRCSTSLSLDTSIDELYKYNIARLGQTLSRKLALALASHAGKKTASDASVEDLVSYLPMRYEDRSNLARIRDLKEGMEASLELYAKVAGGYQVGKKRAYGKPKLFIFEVSATDKDKTGRPVVVWWFVSGAHAHDIVNYYMKRLTQGARFITFGKWEWDARRGTYALRLNKPSDELELLPMPGTGERGKGGDGEMGRMGEGENIDEEESGDPALAAVHAGRRVPIYRKLGGFSSKRLREIIHAVLEVVSDKDIKETLPVDLRERQHLISRAEAFRQIHFPAEDGSLAEYERARSPAHQRLIFEDFFWLALGLGLKRGERIKEPKGARIRIDASVKEIDYFRFAIQAHERPAGSGPTDIRRHEIRRADEPLAPGRRR